MKIYFTCSTAEFKKYEDVYFDIRKYLIDEGLTLTRDWLPHTKKRIDQRITELRDIKEIYKACISSIRDSDLVIIEDTVSNFSTGHQITKALQMEKPTLVLWQGRKYRQFNQMFIHGIDSKLLEIVEYDQTNLNQNIKIFLEKYENVHERNRFHLVLDNLERSYLDWAQYNKGKSRTQIIRDALRKHIEEDVEYDEYLVKT